MMDSRSAATAVLTSEQCLLFYLWKSTIFEFTFCDGYKGIPKVLRRKSWLSKVILQAVWAVLNSPLSAAAALTDKRTGSYCFDCIFKNTQQTVVCCVRPELVTSSTQTSVLARVWVEQIANKGLTQVYHLLEFLFLFYHTFILNSK